MPLKPTRGGHRVGHYRRVYRYAFQTPQRECPGRKLSVYRTTFVWQNWNMVARPFFSMFNKTRYFNWLITWPYTYICTGNTNIGTKRKSHISESIWTKCMIRTKACGFMYGINERAFTCARFTSHMYTDFNNIKIFTCMIFFFRSWLTDPYFETYVTRVSALAKRLNIQF